MFGRKRRRSDDEIEIESVEPAAEADVEAALEADVEADAVHGEPAGPRTGPWDVDDAPADDLDRLDLGSLRVPTLPGVELRLDASENGEVIAATLVDGPSGLQIGAFAAPRSDGIWNEVRGEIFESLRAQGSAVHEQDGPFGPELVAKVATPEGSQDARFVGVDGPRWFVRGVFTGPAATNPQQAEKLERSLQGVIVVRGGEAMPVRDPLPMTMPPEAYQQQPSADGPLEEADGRPAPPPPERGPEITETR